MLDSKVTDWDIVDRTPYGKDVLKTLADACHEHGIKLFFYYSLLDWHHPDYFPRGRTGRDAGRPERGDWKRYLDYMEPSSASSARATARSAASGSTAGGTSPRPTGAWRRTYKIIHELQPGALVGNNHHVGRSPARTSRCSSRTCPARTGGLQQGGDRPTSRWRPA